MDTVPGEKGLAYERWELTVHPDRDTPQRVTRLSTALVKDMSSTVTGLGSMRVPDLEYNAHPSDLQVN